VTGTDATSLEILSTAVDLQVDEHAGSEIIVRLVGQVSQKMKDAYELSVKSHNGAISIEAKRTKSPSFTIFAVNRGVKLTVLVPRQSYELLDARTTSGDIHVAEIAPKRMKLLSHSGDIIAEAAPEISEISMTTEAGDATLYTESSSLQLELNSSSGDIQLGVPGLVIQERTEQRFTGHLGDGSQQIHVETSTGDIQVQS